ncbi:MAG TPA: TonB-dependent receptor [Steroidobacteraceae bacterium]
MGYLSRLRAAVLLAGLCAAFAPPVFPQNSPAATAAPGSDISEITVTGSRISLPNVTSTSPIQVVTQQDIQTSGKIDVSDVILQLPQNFNNSFSDFNGRTAALTVAGGLATADLRGLGPQRTLVLVNGRRLGAADANTANPNPAPDLDQIPTALIERIDVVTGGASSTYGSDAIAGVINFIMKKNFEGLEISGQVGENWHSQHSTFTQGLERQDGITPPTGDIHDGKNKSFDIIFGSSLAEGKGNVTAYFTYLQADPVPSGNRDFGACQLNASPNAAGTAFTGASCSGSGNSNFFQVNGGTVYSVLGNQFVPNGSVPTNPPAVFNSQPYIYNGRDDLRYTAGFMAHVDLNDYAKPYTEFGFMNDRTDQKIAPSALFRGANPLDPTGANSYNVNCDNPFLSSQQAGILCTPAQLAYVAANPGTACLFPDGASSPNCANVNIGRRNIEGGGRESYYEHNNYRAVVGMQGELGPAWRYDAYGQYYYTTFFNINKQYLNFAGISNALQVKGSAANPACISGPPCVPYNIFSDGGVTQDALNYLYLNGSAYGTNAERIAHVDVTGNLGQYGIKSPFANDGLSMNVGYEHRSEQEAFDPDSGEQSGLLAGFGGATAPIHQGYHLNEEFIEFGGALVQDKPGIASLLVDTGFRHSDYSTTGSVNTGKFEVQYQPVTDIRFRGSYQKAIRAPNLIELYNPAVVGLVTAGSDPCAPNEISGLIVATLAQCLRTGVTAAQYNSGSIPQGTGSQLSQLQGGNTQLKPEKADSYSIGATLTPSFLSGFSGSIDYFKIKLKDSIGAIPPGLLLQECLNTGDPQFCSKIVRNPVDGSLTGASVSGGGYIVQTSLNIGAATVSGIDFQGTYKLPLASFGSLGFALNGALLLKDETQPFPGGPTYDCAGLFGVVCGTVNPRWRHNLRTTWSTPWNVQIAATWRFIGKVSLDNNDPNPLLNGHSYLNQNTGGPAFNYFDARLPNFSYIDLAATWQAYKGIEIRAGINNMLDKDPPLVTSEITAGGANNTYETYDTLGRQVFVAFTSKF